MHEKDITEVMNLVFQYLTPPDLAIAAQVSSTWDRIAKIESLEKSTYFYFVDKVIGTVPLKFILKNLGTDELFNVTSAFGICFNNTNTDLNVRHERLCKNIEFDGFVVNIKSNFNPVPIEQETFLRWYNFPVDDFTDIIILSFTNQFIETENYCLRLNLDTNNYDEILCFLSDLDIFFSQENVQSRILIILCQHSNYKKFIKTCQTFSYWFKSQDMTIWLAVVDKLSFCRYSSKHDCKVNSEFIYMFINKPSMIAYTKYIEDKCYTAEEIRSELIIFKEEIKLSLHSIAFMHVPHSRLRDLYELDTSIFKEVFPEIILFPLYGSGSCICSCFDEFIDYDIWSRWSNKHTSILVLTYK